VLEKPSARLIQRYVANEKRNARAQSQIAYVFRWLFAAHKTNAQHVEHLGGTYYMLVYHARKQYAAFFYKRENIAHKIRPARGA